MARLLPLAIILILLSGVAIAQTINVYPEADTWVDVARTPGVLHGSDHELTMVIMPGSLNMPVFYRFNNSLYQDYLFTDIRLRYYVNASGICSANGCFSAFVLLHNNTWDESTLNGTNYPPDDSTILSFDARIGNGGGWMESSNLLSDDIEGTGFRPKTYENTTALIQNLYNTTRLSFSRISTVYGTGSNLKNHTIQSREGSNPPYLQMNVTTHLGGRINTTDLNGFMEFDFETQTNITKQFFLAMDFDYDANLNQITPNSGMGITMSPLGFSSSADNDLQTKVGDCVYSRGYNTTPSSVNPLPGLYTKFCFNLSAQHQGRPFYAMIKVINNTNVRGNGSSEFDFYYEVIAPTQNSFSYPAYSPDPPQAGLNLSVGWTTTQPLTTKMYYRYNDSSSNLTWAYAWQFIEGSQAFTTTHAVTVNNQFTVYGFYELYFTGNNSDGTNYTSQIYNFSITPFTDNPSASLPTAVDRIVDSGLAPNFAAGLYLIGVILLLLISIPVYFLAGTKVGVATFVSMIIAEGIAGLLPIWIIIPFIVYAGALMVRFFGNILGGRNE